MAHTLYDVTLADYSGLVRHLAIAETALRCVDALLQADTYIAGREEALRALTTRTLRTLNSSGPHPPLYYRDAKGRFRKWGVPE